MLRPTTYPDEPSSAGGSRWCPSAGFRSRKSRAIEALRKRGAAFGRPVRA